MKHFSQEDHRRFVERLDHFVAEMVQAANALRASCAGQSQSTDAQCRAERGRLQADFRRGQEQLESDQLHRLAEVMRAYERGFRAAAAEHARTCREIKDQFQAALNHFQQQQQAARNRAEEAYQGTVQAASLELQEVNLKIEEGRRELDALAAEVRRVIRRRRCGGATAAAPEPVAVVSGQPLTYFQQELAAARAVAGHFQEQWVYRFLAGGWLFVIFVFTWIVGVILSVLVASPDWPWVISSGAVALGITAIVFVAVRPILVRQTIEVWQRFQQHWVNAEKALEGSQVLAVAEADQRRLVSRGQRDRQHREADHAFERKAAAKGAERDRALSAAAEALDSQRKEHVQIRDRQQEAVNRETDLRRQQLEERFTQQSKQLEATHAQQTESSVESRRLRWKRLADRWKQGIAEFHADVEAQRRSCQKHFPEWQDVDWETWSPPDLDEPVVQFGQYTIDWESIALDAANDPAESQPPAQLVVPAAHSFASRPLLLWEAWQDGLEVASRSMRNVMLRLFTSLPAGKTRFTIIDPVELGQSFSAFMHLTDLDEKLVSHRIWTEPADISRRLAELTEHMENVIQTYLRNEFETIDQYNRDAGEVAEPFHILVVANFPAGFSDEAAARLLSIVNSGAQCGVIILMSVDSKRDLPRGFDLEALEAQATTLQWDGRQFHWFDPVLRDFVLQLDNAPSQTRFTEIIRSVGKRAREANRIEVPFATVAPQDGQWWRGDSRAGLQVALGKAGATKLQHLSLGQGTSQHVLVSGKTGSGKSTLLHALIMNTALHYAPDEIEFYLVDFKKGVEFKPYAHYRLPHARIVAIESEREFGISVLERLDAELRRRGDLFRDKGVQDIQSFREACPADAMPRVLLVIDEFQELFVQDDKLAQDASLLLDRLVRQGRAFGIHVLLGSQTLAGAYSIARSTIGQMAVRIALQCSEADSHLILSEDNNAARLLGRPGEAIYNDANGLLEGNHPFQVVWLPADEQARYLQRLAELAGTRESASQPPVVFEGNVAADPSQNVLLERALSVEPPAGAVPSAWLGSAVAIKEPTCATFRRQSGSNLVIVGQQEELALGTLSVALISLAATCPLGGACLPRVLILDGNRADTAEADTWRRVADNLPLKFQVAGPRGAAEAVSQIYQELQRRIADSDDAAPAIFLVVYGLSRFRELRRSDDDFGFGGLDEEQSPSPAQQLVALLREGPVFGIHGLIWSDTYSNLTRWFDRQAVRDLDHRVLFQMSATDSSNLIDSTAAGRLGAHRALLYSEEQGDHEKFRPYSVPSTAWLATVRQQFGGRGVLRNPNSEARNPKQIRSTN